MQVYTHGRVYAHTHTHAHMLQWLLWYILRNMTIISSPVMVYTKTPEINHNFGA